MIYEIQIFMKSGWLSESLSEVVELGYIKTGSMRVMGIHDAKLRKSNALARQ